MLHPPFKRFLEGGFYFEIKIKKEKASSITLEAFFYLCIFPPITFGTIH
jgi:hypothetical protein